MNAAPPLIVAFVADLYFASRIEGAANRLGCQVRFIERVTQILQEPAPDDPAGDRQEDLYNLVRGRRPALLVFDLNNHEIPWGDWIPALRADPVSESIPVIAFGSHVETDTLARARAAGARAVLARSRFVTALPEILTKYLKA